MRRVLIPLSVLGAVLLAAGVVAAFAQRATAPSPTSLVLLALGTVTCLGTVNAMLGLERRAGGLDVPEGQELPAPHWPAPVALVGACDVVGGLWAALPMAAIGGLLVFVATVAAVVRARRTPPARLDRGVVVAARRARSLAHAHPGGAPGTVSAQHIGRGSYRLVVVAGDGTFGDVVVRGAERARSAARLSGLAPADDHSGELAGRIRTGPYEWRRMAGTQLGGRRQRAPDHDGVPDIQAVS